jgi:hypothetical protein
MRLTAIMPKPTGLIAGFHSPISVICCHHPHHTGHFMFQDLMR